MHGIYNVQKHFLKNSWKEEYTFSMRGEVLVPFEIFKELCDTLLNISATKGTPCLELALL